MSSKDNPANTEHSPVLSIAAEKTVDQSVCYALFRQEGGDQNGNYFIKTASIFPEQSAKPQSCMAIPRWRSATSTLNCITNANGHDMALVTSTKPQPNRWVRLTDSVHIVSMNDQGELQYKEMPIPPCNNDDFDYTFFQQVITEQDEASKPTHRLLCCHAPKPRDWDWPSTEKAFFYLLDAYDAKFKVTLPIKASSYYEGQSSLQYYTQTYAFTSIDFLNCFKCNNDLYVAFATHDANQKPQRPFAYNQIKSTVYVIKLSKILAANQDKTPLTMADFASYNTDFATGLLFGDYGVNPADSTDHQIVVSTRQNNSDSSLIMLNFDGNQLTPIHQVNWLSHGDNYKASRNPVKHVVCANGLHAFMGMAYEGSAYLGIFYFDPKKRQFSELIKTPFIPGGALNFSYIMPNIEKTETTQQDGKKVLTATLKGVGILYTYRLKGKATNSMNTAYISALPDEQYPLSPKSSVKVSFKPDSDGVISGPHDAFDFSGQSIRR